MTTRTPTATASMSLAALLAVYNRFAPTRRNSDFKNKQEALRRIAEVAPPEEVTPPEVAPETSVVEEATAPVVEEVTAPMLLTVGRDPKDVKGRGIDAKIRLLVDAYPRKTGTDAHRHFELMKDGATIREYMANFVPGSIDAQSARQWIFNHRRSNFIGLDETPAEPQS